MDDIRRFVIKLEPRIMLYLHKTKDLPKIINDICELIITMNISKRQLKKISDKNTKVYYLSSYTRLSNAKNIQTHIKVYATKDKVFFSTANLSLSSFDEITLEFERLESFNEVIEELKNRYNNNHIKQKMIQISKIPILNFLPKTL